MARWNTRTPLVTLTLALVLGTVAASAQVAEIAPVISYQGRILDTGGRPLVGPVDLEVAIYQTEAETLPRYRESHLATPLADGVYSILIGQGTAVEGVLTPDAFQGGAAWLEVAVNGQLLSPRQRFASVPYAFRAYTAAMATAAGDASTVGGRTAEDLDQSAHLTDTANPHFVSAAQTGAATPADVTTAIGAHAAQPSAHHTKTTSFAELVDQVADAQIPAGVARDSEILWSRLGGIPAGFADGVDSTGLASEDDPQVGPNVAGYVPRWDGSALVQGGIFDNGGGWVGIGTATPGARLEISGNLRFSPGADRSITLPDGTRSLFIGGGATPPWSLWLSSASYVALQTAATERLRVNSVGNVGVGTTAPSERLEVAGNVKVTGASNGVTFPDGSKQTTAYRGFPRPNWDSGWVEFPFNSDIQLTHNLGGSVEDYVVDLTFRNAGGIHNKGIGEDYYRTYVPYEADNWRGAYWKQLTATTIRVAGYNNEREVQQMRVRIWVYE